jgi:hypothetical protein
MTNPPPTLADVARTSFRPLAEKMIAVIRADCKVLGLTFAPTTDDAYELLVTRFTQLCADDLTQLLDRVDARARRETLEKFAKILNGPLVRDGHIGDGRLLEYVEVQLTALTAGEMG